jgi:hypothetical protein
MIESRYPDGFIGFLEFLCRKYRIDRSQVFIEFDFKAPPPVKGGRFGYYDGLLSYRERAGRFEFLITVFSIASDPLLTLGHEFAHLVDDMRSGNVGKLLRPPDDVRERKFDDQAREDLSLYRTETR